MQAVDLLYNLKEQGFILKAEGVALYVSPKERLTDDLRQLIREHKSELLALLHGKPRAIILPQKQRQLLKWALASKQCELAHRKADLASEYYKADPWVKDQIVRLEAQIEEIERFLSEGGNLNLPRCCHRPGYLCLAAIRGFTACLLRSDHCGYLI